MVNAQATQTIIHKIDIAVIYDLILHFPLMGGIKSKKINHCNNNISITHHIIESLVSGCEQ